MPAAACRRDGVLSPGPGASPALERPLGGKVSAPLGQGHLPAGQRRGTAPRRRARRGRRPRGASRTVPTSPRRIGPVRADSMPSVSALARVWRIRGSRWPATPRSSSPAAASELGDRVEQADEPARGQDRRRVVGGLAARRQADRLRADSPRQGRTGRRAGPRHPRARPSRPAAPRPSLRRRRRRPGDGSSRRSCRPPAPAASTAAGRAPLRWTMPWPPYRRSSAATLEIASSGTVRNSDVHVVEERGAGPHGSRAGYQLFEARAPFRVAAGDRHDRPAGAAERDAEGRARVTGADEADARAARRIVAVGADAGARPVRRHRARAGVRSPLPAIVARGRAGAGRPRLAAPMPRCRGYTRMTQAHTTRGGHTRQEPTSPRSAREQEARPR